MFVLDSRFVYMLFLFSLDLSVHMIYTGNIHLADDLIYTYEYYTCQYEINHYPWALQSITVNFCVYRPFSRFSRLAGPEAAHLELSRHRLACSTLNYW